MDEDKRAPRAQITELLRELVRPGAAADALPPFAGTPRFQVLQRLGAGGFGVVYLVQDLTAGEQLALKTLAAARPELIYRLKHEFRALADLRHENLVSFRELFAEGDRVFFTMEYVQGLPFHEHVRPGGVLDEARLRSALAQLVRGLSALHAAGKLHRDVKPSNVLVTPRGRVVLLDFGLATEIEEGGVGRTVDRAGTPGYMSPEQAVGAPLSPASDWYTVGVLLYQSMTGRLPPRTVADGAATDSRARRAPAAPPPEGPRDLAELCAALLADDPARRPGAAAVARVVARSADALRAGDEQGTTKLPFVGRDRELGLLRGALERVLERRGSTVLVEGTSGIGKTTLVQRFLTQARNDHGATVLRGRCYERERVPYQGIDSLVDDLCRLLRSLDAGAVARVLPRHLGALVRLFPVLERVPAVAECRAGAQPLGPDAQELRRLAFGAIRELLARLADRHPLVLHIDDLQWGDLDTAALLREVVHPPDPPPLVLVLSFRAEERGRSPCLQALADSQLGDVVHVEVGPLDGATAQELASTLLSSRKGDAGRIAAESGGSPFFIQELARFALDVGARGARGSPDLVAALRARIEQLPPAPRRLLDVVTVAGHPVPEPLARRAAGCDRAGWDAWHVLDQARLIRFGGARDAPLVEPYHDRIREVALGVLPAAGAVACHIGLARALEESGAADPEVLARHLEAGGATDRARSLASLAATQAEQALAFDRAARLFRWALALTAPGDARRPPLLGSLALALANAGRGIEASRAYLEAAELAPAGARAELRRRAAEQLLLSGRMDEGRELVSEDLRAAGFAIPRTPRRAVASLAAQRALLRLRGLAFTARPEAEVTPRDLALLDHLWAVNRALSLVDVVRSADFAARHLLAALRVGETERVFRGLVLTAGHAAAEAPVSRRTAALCARLEELARGLGPPARGWVSLVAAVRSMMGSAFLPALASAAEAERIFRDECTGTVWETWSARMFHDWPLFYLGRWRELAGRCDAHLHEARERGNVYAMTLTRAPFGAVTFLARGDVERARESIREAVAGWSATGFHLQHYWFLIAQCFLDLHAGRGDAAWARVQERWPGLERSLALRMPFVRTQLMHLRGSCAVAAAALAPRGRERDALLATARRAARSLDRVRLPLAPPFAALVRAGVASVQGDRDSAARSLEAAAIELERQAVAPYAAAARWQRARLGGVGAPPSRFLAGEDVAAPDAVARMLVPGCGH